jgi:hypothetical protein
MGKLMNRLLSSVLVLAMAGLCVTNAFAMDSEAVSEERTVTVEEIIVEEQDTQPAEETAQELEEENEDEEELQVQSAEERVQTQSSDQEEAADQQPAGKARSSVQKGEIRWKQNGKYGKNPSYTYTGEAIRPAYQVVQGSTVLEGEWEEEWYSDSSYSKQTENFTDCGTIYLRLKQSGVVVAEGSYTITPASQEITGVKSSLEKQFKKNGTFTLDAVASGGGKLTYSSSNKNVLTVSSKGVCTFQHSGTTTITITAAATNNYKSVTYKVKVKVWGSALYLGYSSSYKNGKYYKALMNLELTGTNRENVVAVALSQLGYHEGRSSSQLSGTVSGSSNYTEYGRYVGMNPAAWCAIFVNWCAREAGISTSVIPNKTSTSGFLSYYKSKNRFKTWSQIRQKNYKPKAGDIIFYSGSSGGSVCHVGYVVSAKYSGSSLVLTTVEGNYSDKVTKITRTIRLSGSGSAGGLYIMGVGRPAY